MSPENSKPEWFQMAEDDGFAPKSTRKRTLRIMALATPLLVLGAGFVFAQTQDSPTASATSTPSAAATNPISLASTPTLAPSAPAPSAPAPSAAPIVASTQVSKTVAATTRPTASITIKKPTISKPTGGAEEGGLVRTSDDD